MIRNRPLIQKDVVVNVIRLADDAAWTPPPNTIVGPEGGNIGDAWDGNRYIPPKAPEPPSRPRRVRKSIIIKRLHEAGKLAAAKAALDADLYARERWYAPDQPSVHADNAEVLSLLRAIGVDAETILAPE